MKDVFVSYDHDDRERIRPLVEALEQRGLSVFWDRNIPPGSTWDEVLEQQLDGARCAVVVWTERSRESEWVRTEASRALRLGKLVPVRLDDVAMPLEFDRVHHADLTRWSAGESHDDLDALLAAVVGRVRGEGSGAAPERRTPWARVAGTVAAAAVAAGALVWLSRAGHGLSPKVVFALVVATLAATIAGGAGARALALLGRRSLRPRTLAASAGVLGALALAGGFVLAAGPRNVALVLHGQGGPGDCPAGLDAAQLIVAPADPALPESPPLQIDARCTAAYPAPRAALGRPVRIRLASQRDFVLAAPGAEHRLDGRPIAVEVRAAREVPRLDLVLFRYQGGAQGQEKFNELRGVLEDMTRTQAQSLASVSGFEYLGGLQVRYTERALDSAPDQVRDEWRSLHALGILAGTVWSETPFPVDSTVFLGDLDPALPGIALRTRIRPEEFDTVRKAHWAAVLYALAMDARQLGKPVSVVSRYLSEARDAASDVREERGMQELLVRIDAALRREVGDPP